MDSVILSHAIALGSSAPCYHDFLYRYSKSKKIVYGFVEGIECPSFYKSFIESKLPEGWTSELWPAGNKENVFKIYNGMNWANFSKERIAFFVDRDLSSFIPESTPIDINIYVTDGYAIENYIVNRDVCCRILTELCGLGNIPHSEIDSICDMFDVEFDKFLIAMIPIMAYIVHWRRRNLNACLNNISMNHLFSFSDDVKLVINNNPHGHNNVGEYIHVACDIAYDASISLSHIEDELKIGSKYRSFTRGKYVLWFLVKFCITVRDNACQLVKSVKKIKPHHLEFGENNAVAVLGNRAKMPASLSLFIDATFLKFIKRNS